MATAVRQYVRNVNKVTLYKGPMNVDFRTDVGDIQDNRLLFVQAMFTGNNDSSGVCELYVGARFCGTDDYLVPFPCGQKQMSDSCPALGWHISDSAFRFFQIRFTANTVMTGEAEIIAIAKKG